MNTHKFVFLDKRQLDIFLPELFDILYANMSQIAPTGNTYEEDWNTWRSFITPDMQDDGRQIVLFYADNTLVGFFRYFLNADNHSIMMEEIQIKKVFHGTGLFKAFYKWLVRQLPKDILYVEAYANKANDKSQAVLKHLGLVQLGENKNGLSYYFKGNYADLLRKYL